MRKQYQQGSVAKSTDRRYWVGKYREGGRHKTKLLGKLRGLMKSKAQEKFAEILKPLSADSFSADFTLKSFVEAINLPFHERKCKKSTLMTNQDRKPTLWDDGRPRWLATS